MPRLRQAARAAAAGHGPAEVINSYIARARIREGTADEIMNAATWRGGPTWRRAHVAPGRRDVLHAELPEP
jgi:hypothetical protein